MLPPWKKSCDKPRQCIKKLETLLCWQELVKAIVFLVVMHGYESWRIDAFELWCWRRLLRVPWTTRRSNQSILKEISSEYSLEGLILKVQYFGHLMWRTDSFEKILMLGRIEAGGEGDDRGWDGWMSSPILWTSIWANSGNWWWYAWHTAVHAVHGVTKSQTQLRDWTELNT